jgi:hypothetical protein
MSLTIPDPATTPAGVTRPNTLDAAPTAPASASDTTGAGLAFGNSPDAPSPLAAPSSLPAPTGETIPAHQLAETPEVTAASTVVWTTEGRLAAAKRAKGTPDVELKKLALDLASAKLALAKAKGEPPTQIEKLSDKRVVAKVLLAAATATDKKAVVAFIRGPCLFMENENVDYVRALDDDDRDALVKQTGRHVQIVRVKPGENVYRPSAPAMYRQFYQDYPAQRIQPSDMARIRSTGPQVIKATSENRDKLKFIKKAVDDSMTYRTDMAQWGKFQQ